MLYAIYYVEWNNSGDKGFSAYQNGGRSSEAGEASSEGGKYSLQGIDRAWRGLLGSGLHQMKLVSYLTIGRPRPSSMSAPYSFVDIQEILPKNITGYFICPPRAGADRKNLVRTHIVTGGKMSKCLDFFFFLSSHL